ncbi:GspE/PulE family protein [Microbacterium sp.]|uniref:GspE/PulE family protein n=1 Tax=Microbacterium sp. TaxID=51671 RepID=UPI002600D942|nr:ATPase, T2SS/T4P/T4SS family [Microbacterium sp.]
MDIKIRDTRNATEWVTDLLNGAIGTGVTDLQLVLNREKEQLIVRARVNRVMEQIAAAEGSLANEVINRIKSRASISTGPAQAISDGLYEHDTGFSEHDLRVALFPSVEGEAIALRLPAKQETPTLEDVKFNELNEARVNELLGMANGLMLMAGPMGAGKTTTMYAILEALGGPKRNVFTVEDPVERVLPGAVQIQINDQARNGWPEVLRGLRRSDLEVLMIGEVRNGEQAQAALEIGNAGAKVVSSIHANDSVGAVHQLLELSKTSPRMLGNQLRGVVSQRLVRKLHVNCAGQGCADCAGSGYKGVQPIHEVLIVGDEIVQAMVEGASASTLRDVAQSTGMETLWQAAHRLIAQGITDHREAVRVLGIEPTDDKTPATAAPVAPATPTSTPDTAAHVVDAPVARQMPAPVTKEQSDERTVPLPVRSPRPAADPAAAGGAPPAAPPAGSPAAGAGAAPPAAGGAGDVRAASPGAALPLPGGGPAAGAVPGGAALPSAAAVPAAGAALPAAGVPAAGPGSDAPPAAGGLKPLPLPLPR